MGVFLLSQTALDRSHLLRPNDSLCVFNAGRDHSDPTALTCCDQ